MLTKHLMFCIILIAANNAEAQNNQQQKNLGKILNEQKLWQQSKMPTKTIYNNNSSYKVPLFPGQRFYQGEGITPYTNNTVPKPEKTKFSFNVKYPTHYTLHTGDSIGLRNRSFVKFK